MQFREYATTETSALVDRILEGPEQALHDLEAFRQALEESSRRVDEIATRLRATNREDGVSSLADKLAAAANAAAQGLVQRAQADAQAQIQRAQAETQAQIQRAQAEAQAQIQRAQAETQAQIELTQKDAQKAITRLRSELEGRLAAESEAAQQLAAALEDARASVDSLRNDRQSAVEREEAAIAREKAATERERAASERERAARSELTAREKAAAKLEKAAADREKAMRAELASKAKMSSTETETALEAREKAVRAELDAQIRELKSLLDSAQQELARARDVVNAEPADRSLDRFVDVFHDIATGQTVPDILVRLARGLTNDFTRVALFNVKGKRLEGVYQVGFDFANDISKLALPLPQESLLTSAIESGHVEARRSGESQLAAPPPFDSSSGCALALPIMVRGQALAVIYADDADRAEGDLAPLDARIKVAEIMQQHAAPRVESLAIEQKTLEELRAYAKLLIDEVENMYAADAAAGAKEADLQARLKENVECALQIYAQRVASEGPAAAALIDERLRSTIEAKQNAAFGRDLSAIVTRKHKKPGGSRKASAR